MIPAYNDEGVIDSVLASLEPYGYSVVVVDDGSRRRLADQLASRRVHLCRHLVNLGQRAALQTGIDYALLHGAEYIVTFNADGQHCAGDIPRLLEAVTTGGCDVALGSRLMQGGQVENIPRAKLLALRVAVLFTRLLVGLPLTDTHNVFVRDRSGTHRDEFFYTTAVSSDIRRIITLYTGRWEHCTLQKPT